MLLVLSRAVFSKWCFTEHPIRLTIHNDFAKLLLLKFHTTSIFVWKYLSLSNIRQFDNTLINKIILIWNFYGTAHQSLSLFFYYNGNVCFICKCMRLIHVMISKLFLIFIYSHRYLWPTVFTFIYIYIYISFNRFP